MSTTETNPENSGVGRALRAPEIGPVSGQRPVPDGHTAAPDHLLPSGGADNQHLLPAPRENGGDADADGTPAGPDGGQPQKTPDPDKPKPGNLRLILIIAVLALAALFVIGLLQRLHSSSNTKTSQKAARDSQQSVQVVTPQKAPPFTDVILPGDIQAVQQTAINARATGYVQKYYHDIGDKVVKGELLATIETPDLAAQVAQARAQLAASQAQVSQSQANLVGLQGDLAQAQANLARSEAAVAQAREQLAQAQAQLAQSREAAAQQRSNLTQAQANRDLALVTNRRYQNLVRQGAVDQETADQQAAAYQTAQANVDALQAALNASLANILSFQAGVKSAVANVRAYQGGVTASIAAVATARANVTAGRAVVASAEANVRSNQANLQRLIVLQGFNQVTAPFTGVITARNIDNGALIGSNGASASGGSDTSGSAGAGVSSGGSAASGGSTLGSSSSVSQSSSSSALASSSAGSGTSAGTSGALFSEAQIGILHIYVNVGESYAAQVRVGTPAVIGIASLPGRKFHGTVTRTSDALDPTSRTLVTEVRVVNSTGVLKPGMFAEVTFHLPSPRGVLVPDTSIITNTSNTQVIEVTPQDTLHFVPITVARDFGNVSLVPSGLKGNEKLVATPTDAMVERQKVTIQQNQQGGGKEQKQAGNGQPQNHGAQPGHGGQPAPAGRQEKGGQQQGGGGGSQQEKGGGPPTQSDAGAGTFLPQGAGPTAAQSNASSSPAGNQQPGKGGGG